MGGVYEETESASLESYMSKKHRRKTICGALPPRRMAEHESSALSTNFNNFVERKNVNLDNYNFHLKTPER